MSLKRLWKILAGIAAVIMIAAASLFVPLNQDAFASHPFPAADFAEARSRIDALQKAEADSIVPACRTRFFSHETRTTRVIVLVHGYTSCPEQFATLGKQLFDEGHNVLIVPLPFHGLADRMTVEHSRLKAVEVVD